MTCKLNADTSDGLKIVSDTSGEIDLQIDASTKVHMASDGKVGIGTTSPAINFETSGSMAVSDTSTASKRLQLDSGASSHTINSANYGSDMMDLNIQAENLIFKTGLVGVADRFVIDSEGQMLFGGITSELTNNGGVLQLKSRTGSEHCATFRNGVSDGGFGINFQNTSGTEVGSIRWTSSATNFNTSSDYRLKENVTYTFDATTEVKKLKPCKFNFKDESDTIEGFLAHEVSDVVPLAVTGTKDAKDSNDNPIYQSIDQSKLVPLLVKTIQELEARITALES